MGLSSWLVWLYTSTSGGGGELGVELRDALFSPEPRNIIELGGYHFTFTSVLITNLK